MNNPEAFPVCKTQREAGFETSKGRREVA